MYIEGATAAKIFSSTENRLILNGLELPVVSAEHLVAMKLFAIQNNPDRKFKDLADIKEILRNTKYNKKRIKEYFVKYGQESYFDEIAKEINKE